MKINVIAVGKVKGPLLLSVQEYLKMISKYTDIEVIEIKEETTPLKASEKTINSALDSEGENILKRISDKEYVIALAPHGKKLDSLCFSEELNNAFSLGQSKVTFIIGSSHGLSNNIYTRANKVISFSDLTFPHQLFRVLLLEQIFRAFKILNNETYHK